MSEGRGQRSGGNRKLITVFGLAAIVFFCLLAFTFAFPFARSVAACNPDTCSVSPAGVCVCSNVFTRVPLPPPITVPPGPPGPTRPVPTRPPTPTPPPGMFYWWRYCVADATSPTGFYHIRYVCENRDGQRFCSPNMMTLFTAYNCNSPTPVPIDPKRVPCPPGFSQTESGLTVFCAWERRVEVRIPPLPITYTPYPRGLVNDPMKFFAPAMVVQPWNCSERVDGWNPQEWRPDEDYRSAIFCLRWRQVAWPDPAPDPAPGWLRYTWDERAWGDPKTTSARQQMVEHVYVTSSALKSENGPQNLPAYQVQVQSFWILDWRIGWEKRVRWHTCEPGGSHNTCDGVAGWRTVRHERWDVGADHGSADLRRYGLPNFYATSTLITIPDGRRMTILPVPVIEVQGVIGAPP